MKYYLAAAESVLESGIQNQEYRVPFLAPIGSFVQTQWGPRKVIRHEPARYVEATPDCPPGC